ncbi:phosphotransferase [Streptomyces sp. NBC_01190]|uniref:phosphotransferase n=1 Tax=Streptomyces sp. NBC_01190 TaxID=2903767 RepID=UPI00386FAC6B|nr:aminoglycoside phosphotransferase family protein [Streptomyces sp. NBC_01190]
MWSRLPFGDGLRAELGEPRRSRRLSSSPRSRVWSVELAAGPAVVKQIVDAPDAAARYGREVSALRLAARVEPPVVPVLLGTDSGNRVLVLEKLAHRPPPPDWTVDYAAALARLHAAGARQEVGALPAWSGPTRDDIGSFLTLAEALGVSVPPGVAGELDDLLDRLAQAPRNALLHGDPCPGNDLHTGDGVKFVDFEQAALGNGLTELAYLRVGFPTCWCVTTADAPLLDRAEAAYRTAWRAATGAEPEGDLTDACAGWLLRGDALVQRAERETVDHLARIPSQDWTWGTATARQRLVHRLTVVSRHAADRPDLTALTQLTTGMLHRMTACWPALRPVPAQRP